MVNLTDVRGRGVPDSGMDDKLERRWWFFNGEVLPLGRGPLDITRLLPRSPPPWRDTGPGAGAKAGREVRAMGRLPRFSLKLRDSPGRMEDLTGETKDALSNCLLGAISLTLADRRRSFRMGALETGGLCWTSVDWGAAGADELGGCSGL